MCSRNFCSLAAGMIANIVAGQSADVCVARGLAAARLSLASIRYAGCDISTVTVVINSRCF